LGDRGHGALERFSFSLSERNLAELSVGDGPSEMNPDGGERARGLGNRNFQDVGPEVEPEQHESADGRAVVGGGRFRRRFQSFFEIARETRGHGEAFEVVLVRPGEVGIGTVRFQVRTVGGGGGEVTPNRGAEVAEP
jgi:hypothetical protein